MTNIKIGKLAFASLILASASGMAQVSGTWSATGSLGTARYAVTAVTVRGKVLLAGGIDSVNNVVASAELYDPAVGAWSPTGSMSTARNTYLTAVLPSGKVLV